MNFPSEKDDLNKKKKNISCLCFITQLKSWKTSYSFNDSKRTRIASYCSKRLPALLLEVTSKHQRDFYCLNCLHFFATENKRESRKKICENKDFYNVVIPFEDTELLELNQYQKSDKAPFIIYVDLECLLEKIDGCKNNPENSSTIKVGGHIPPTFSISWCI